MVAFRKGIVWGFKGFVIFKDAMIWPYNFFWECFYNFGAMEGDEKRDN